MPISFQLDDDLLKALAQKCPTMAANQVMREAVRQYVSNKPVVSDKPVVRDALALSAAQRDRVLRYAKRRGVSPQNDAQHVPRRWAGPFQPSPDVLGVRQVERQRPECYPALPVSAGGLMEEQRKYAILFAATILAARKLHEIAMPSPGMRHG